MVQDQPRKLNPIDEFNLNEAITSDRSNYFFRVQDEASQGTSNNPLFNQYPRPSTKEIIYHHSISMALGEPRSCSDHPSATKRKARTNPMWSTETSPTHHDLSFTERDAEAVIRPHNDSLVIQVSIEDINIPRVLVDTGCSVSVIFMETLLHMKVDPSRIERTPEPLTSFTGKTTMTLGSIELAVRAEGITKSVNFSVVDRPAIYSAVLGIPWLNLMQAVASPYHMCIKFPTSEGIKTIRGSQQESRACMLTEHKLRRPVTDRIPENKHKKQQMKHRARKQMSKLMHQLQILETGEEEPSKSSKAMKDESSPTSETTKDESPDPLVVSICIDEEHPERCIEIGAQLEDPLRANLIAFLKNNINTFAWAAEDMPGISTDIACHELNVDPTFKPIKQKRRKLGTERAQAVNDEVERLLKVGSITEVKYPDWLANPVVVKKKNGKWRVCVDFTDLNKACPKDSFPLPHIDRLVEATAGNQLLSFMDAFSGYNQIFMHPYDREKTAFITDRGTYCYKVMPFGLKNAGATYQRLVNKMFAEQLGKTMEVYIDDMLVKSLKQEEHIAHLEDCFKQLNKHNMKLNPTKCRFGVTSGEFLGYLVTHRGIEANPKQIKALRQMASPKNKREVQRLTGRIAALNRFISRSTDKCLPFYNLLRGNKRFEWTEKCEEAFQQLKDYLEKAPILAKPVSGEPLFLYIAVSMTAVSGVLIREERGEQQPVFYVSKTLADAETRYPQMEKLALAVVMSARKLRPYFQSHSIIVLTPFPLRTILHSPSQSGRLAKWAIELSEYDIEYRSRTSTKAQVLADFLVELPEGEDTNIAEQAVWTLHADGSSSKQGSGAGILLASPTGEIIEQSIRFDFHASNNEAEYEALIAGLRLALGIDVRRIHAFCDSQLVVNQFNGEYEARDERMEAYLSIVKELSEKFTEFALTRISRNENSTADALAALGSTSDPELRRVIPVELLSHPSIHGSHSVNLVGTRANPVNDQPIEDRPAEHQPDENHPTEEEEPVPMETDEIGDSGSYGCDTPWMDKIKLYITNGDTPSDKWAARKLRGQAARFVMKEERLYKWGLGGPLLTCLEGEDARKVMKEVHSGSCGNHSGGRSLAIRIKRHGFYWPTMIKDCEQFSAKCEKCQRHAPTFHQPTEMLTSVSSPYPFMRWSMDIVGPLHNSKQKRFLLVLTDYFSKWVEAEAYASIKDAQVEHFVWKFIICRHGVPYEIVTDNGSQFISARFEAFCEKWKIRLSKSTPRYPQGNGQAEAANKTILDGLKKRLDAKKGRWADELDGVLWSHRTTPRRPTGETPFALVYGTECVIPSEVEFPGIRRTLLPQHEDVNQLLQIDELDLIDERRDQAYIRLQNYQQAAAKYYNSHVRPRQFRESELVLRKVFQNTAELNAGKLGTNWEGPYRISKVVKPGVYELTNMEGIAVPRSWNAMHLKKYYH